MPVATPIAAVRASGAAPESSGSTNGALMKMIEKFRMNSAQPPAARRQRHAVFARVDRALGRSRLRGIYALGVIAISRRISRR